MKISMSIKDLAHIVGGTQHGANPTFQGISIDSRNIAEGQLFIAIKGDTFDGHDFVNAAHKACATAAIVSKDTETDLPTIKVADTKDALIKIAAYWRQQFSIPVVAITGSCGKTTTRAMLASILEQVGPTLSSEKSYNNDIGVPLTLLRLNHTHQFAVLELGANHPGEIAQLTNIVKPTVALITLAGPVHLEGFKDLPGVAKAKGEIYQGLTDDGIAIINKDDFFADYWQQLNQHRRVLTFSSQSSATVEASEVFINKQSRVAFKATIDNGDSLYMQLKPIGMHHLTNGLAAITAAYALHIPLITIREGLFRMEPEKRRTTEYSGLHGATIIDDSYNANPPSVRAALDILAQREGPSIFVFGDMLELGKDSTELHKNVGTQALQAGIQKLYCYGDQSKVAVQTFGQNGYHFKDQQSLIEHLKTQLNRDVTVLVKGSKAMHMDQITAQLIQE